MASNLRNLSIEEGLPVTLTKEYSVGIIVSEYNSHITYALRDACIETLEAHGVRDIYVDYAPGAFELPLAAKLLHDNIPVHAVIAFGCVIKGDTEHDVYIYYAVAKALMDLNLSENKPFVFGLLTVNNEQQALDRAGGLHGNKGTECALAALKMLSLNERLEKV